MRVCCHALVCLRQKELVAALFKITILNEGGPACAMLLSWDKLPPPPEAKMGLDATATGESPSSLVRGKGAQALTDLGTPEE